MSDMLSPPPADRTQQLRLLEAMLFAAPEPLALAVLEARLPGAPVPALLAELQLHYQGRGVAVQERDGRWCLRTSADLADLMRDDTVQHRRLPRAAAETLAIIAYHQPITRPEIESIRGVQLAGNTLDILLEAGWVEPGRKLETPGRPSTWVTTAAFLDHFGLPSLRDLPGLEELKAAGLLDRAPVLDGVQLSLDEIADSASPDDGLGSDPLPDTA